jgi:putative acetyltransferase
MYAVRSERSGDVAAIRHVHLGAFDTTLEADLVDALRVQASPLVSLVADADGTVVGHILFSPVTLASRPEVAMMGLAPMAVTPERQRQGVGSALVRAGLDECRRLGITAVVLIGHAEYYPRFGFVRASGFGLTSEYDVPDDVFMAIELKAGALGETAGIVRFHPAFPK